MTTLEKIVKKAQDLRKKAPNKFAKWTDYVKEASKEFKALTTSVKKKSKLGFKQENLDTYINRAKFLKTLALGSNDNKNEYTFKGYDYFINIEYNFYDLPTIEVKDKNRLIAIIDKNSKLNYLIDNFINWLYGKGFKTYNEKEIQKLHKELKPIIIKLMKKVKSLKKTKKQAPKKAIKKQAINKSNSAQIESDRVRAEVKSKKFIMPHGYEVRRSKLGAIMSISDNAKQLIIDCIDLSGYEKNINDPLQKIRAVEKIFYTEYGFMINRIGKLKALTEWLQGLPSVLTLPFYNVEILEIAKKWGSLKPNATEKQEDKILLNYWNYMANQLLQLFNKKKLSNKFN